MICPTCEEYSVDYPPTGMGGIGNLCEHCTEYSIPTSVPTKEEDEDEDTT